MWPDYLRAEKNVIQPIYMFSGMAYGMNSFKDVKIGNNLHNPHLFMQCPPNIQWPLHINNV